jgi:DNA invertase Pin-like site-specific DNA recombinase
MAVIGYARVSSIGQSLEIQIDKLSNYGCEKIYKEKRSGTTAQRPEMKACLDYVRDGDVLVITKLDRLARSTFHLHKIVNDLNNKGVGFKVLDQSFDTTTRDGRLMFSILASIAEFETELRSERQLEGIAKAKENGVSFGPKAKLNDKQLEMMKKERATGVLIKDLMKKYDLSKASVYRLLANNSNRN